MQRLKIWRARGDCLARLTLILPLHDTQFKIERQMRSNTGRCDMCIGQARTLHIVISIFNQFFNNWLSKNQFFLRFSKIRFRLIDHTKIEKSILNSFIRDILKYSEVGPEGRHACGVTKNANSKFELLIRIFFLFFSYLLLQQISSPGHSAQTIHGVNSTMQAVNFENCQEM